MRLSLRIAIIVAVQTAVLLVMVGLRQWTLATGTPVVLETQPIDPRSLFSGDYVRLNYKVSDLKLGELAGDKEFRRGDKAYVVLKRGEDYWTAVSVHRERVSAAEGQVVLKGRVETVADRMWDRQLRKWSEGKHMSVRYGIEEYFVPEGEGRDLERPKPGEKVEIEIAVDRYGNAGIRAVLVNGKPRYVERLL